MTFLFDIGNVLLKLHFHRFHQAILGTPNTRLPTALLALKTPYETGTLTCAEFVNQALNILKNQLTPSQFITAWEDIFTPNDPMWELVHLLHQQGHRLILFSNTNTIHTQAFLRDYPDFALFHHHHFSQEIGEIKPNDAFYQKAIDAYDLIPSETLYLDDLPENIATGKRLGFQSWQYDIDQHSACLDWLATHLSRKIQ